MKLQKIGALLLSLTLLLTVIPYGGVSLVAAEATPKAALPTIKEQIRAYAKSIDQPKADDAASTALATHGIASGGRKFNMDESHSLTATLMNANLTQMQLVDACTTAIRAMQQLHRTVIYAGNSCNWYETYGSYSAKAYLDPEKITATTMDYSPYTEITPSSFNAYDRSLIWMTGATSSRLILRQQSITRDTVTYEVSVRFYDRFDFSVRNEDISNDLMSILGSSLFREFDWEATLSFTLVAPNICPHDGYSYHWTYDPDQNRLRTDGSNGFTANTSTTITRETSSDKKYYHHRFSQPITLYHDLPWVMEYTMPGSKSLALAPTDYKNAQMGYLYHYAGKYLFFSEQAYDENGKMYSHYYGTALRENYLQKYKSTYTYTFRLENHVNPDGSNMIYVSVFNDTLGEPALLSTPMDDYYLKEGSATVLQDEQTNHLSGKDWIISFAGNHSHIFNVPSFELSVWETGLTPTGDEYDIVSTAAPTCTADGGVTHTCRLCGYETFDKTADKLGHDLGQWVQSKAPTCTAQGEERRDCKRCDHFERRSMAKLPHRLTPHEGKAPSCTETGWQAYEACADCDYTTYAALPTLPHSYESVMTPPSCVAVGYTTHTCTVCGDSYKDGYTEAAGHNYQSVTTPPTCTEGGYITHTCTICGHSFTDSYSSANPHQYQYSVTAPTCSEPGYMVYTCAYCGDSFSNAFGAPTGRHQYDNACDADCNSCGGVREVSGHAYSGVITAPATCGTDGAYTYTCRHCGHRYTEAIPATGEHRYDGDRDPDCNGCGAIREVVAVLYGDINGDDKVNNRDLGVLQQYLNAWGVTADLTAADVNVDGKVNNRDLGLLQQHLNGWGTELG